MARRRVVRTFALIVATAMFLQPVAVTARGSGDDRSTPLVLPSAPALAFTEPDSVDSVLAAMAPRTATPASSSDVTQGSRASRTVTRTLSPTSLNFNQIDLERLLTALEMQVADVEYSQAQLQAQADAINEQSVLVVFRSGTTSAEALAVLDACGMVSLGAFGTSGLYIAAMKPGQDLEAGIVKLQGRPEVVAADSLFAAVNQSGSPANGSTDGNTGGSNSGGSGDQPPAGDAPPAAEPESDEPPAPVGDPEPAPSTDAGEPPADTGATGSDPAVAVDAAQSEQSAQSEAAEAADSAPTVAPASVDPEPAAVCADLVDPEGYVTDAATALPLRNVRMQVTDTASGTLIEGYTNHDGYYSILVPNGTYLISALLAGYAPASVTRVVAGTPITQDFALADVTAPRLVVGSGRPTSGATVGSRPLIGAVYWDAESGVAGTTLLVDGVEVSADATSGALSVRYRPDEPLSEGEHTVSVTVRDRAGNEAASTWSFVVAVSAAGDSGAAGFGLGTMLDVAWDDSAGLRLGTTEVLGGSARAPGIPYALSAVPDVDGDPGGVDLTDGDDATRVAYGIDPDSSVSVDVTLDMGVARRVGRASLTTGSWSASWAADVLDVLVSLDGVTFVSAGGTVEVTGGVMTATFAPTDARYVLFRVGKSAGAEGGVLELDEGRVYEALLVYASSGVFESRVIDTGAPSDYFTIDWGPAGQPPGTEVRVQIAGLDAPDEGPNWAGPDGTALTFFTVSSSRKLPALTAGKRYLRYRVQFSSTDPGFTPTLSRIAFSYENRGPPSVSDSTLVISSPLTGSVLQGSTIALEGSASDSDGSILGVFTSSDGGTSWRPADTSADHVTWSATIPSEHGGTYQIIATAVGSDLQTATAHSTVRVTSVPGPTVPYAGELPPGDPPIHGTDGADTILLTYNGTTVQVWVNSVLVLTHTPDAADPIYTVYGNDGHDTITLTSTTTLPAPFRVVVYGGAGNDRVDASGFASALVTELRGGIGDDTYVYDEDFGFGSNFQIFENPDAGTDTIAFIGYTGTASVSVDAGTGAVTLTRTQAPARTLILSSALMDNLERLTGLDLILSADVLEKLAGPVLDDLVAWAANLISSELLADSYLNRLLPVVLANVGVSIGNALDLPGVMETLRTYLRSVIRNNLPATDPTLSDLVSAISGAIGTLKTLARYGAGVVGDRLVSDSLVSGLAGSLTLSVTVTWVPDSAKPTVTRTDTVSVSASLVGVTTVSGLVQRIQTAMNGVALAGGRTLGALLRAAGTAGGALVIDVNSRSVTALRVTPSNSEAQTLFGFAGQRIAQLANRVDFPDDLTTALDDRLNQLALRMVPTAQVGFYGGQLSIGVALAVSGTASTEFAIDLGDTFREMRGITFDVNAKMRMNVAYSADFVLSAVLGNLFVDGRMTISRLNLEGAIVPSGGIAMNVGFLAATATFSGELRAQAGWTATGAPLVIAPSETGLAGLLAKVPAGTSISLTITVAPDTTLPGLGGLPTATMTLSGSNKDPFDPATYSFSNWVLSTSMTGFLPFNEVNAAGVVSMLRSLAATIQRLIGAEFEGFKLPFAGTAVSGVIDFVTAFASKLIDGDDRGTPDDPSDDIKRLLDGNGMLTFASAQTLLTRLNLLSGITATGSYDADTKELLYTIAFNGFQLTLFDLPINFRLDLGSLANIQSTTRVVLDSRLGMKIAFGFNLDPTASGAMGWDTLVSALKVPPAVNTRPVVTAAESVPAPYGRLSGDATFKLTVAGAGAGTYDVTLTRDNTKGITDTGPVTLALRLQTALTTAGVPSSVVEVKYFDYDNQDTDASTNGKEWRLALVAGAGVTGISITAASGSVFANELGFLYQDAGTTQKFEPTDATSQLMIKAGSTLKPTIGRLAGDRTVTITLSGSAPVGGVVLNLTLAEADTKDNRTMSDLVFDLRAALKAALAGKGIFTAEQLVTLDTDSFLRVGSQAGASGSTSERLVFTAVDSRIASFVVNALADLGLIASPVFSLTSSVHDFVITASNGSAYRISLAALPAAPTIGNLRTLIETVTGGNIRVHLTALETENKPLWDGKRIVLEDRTYTTASPKPTGMFRVETIHGSRAALDLGILARDAVVTAERDGYIEGNTVYGLSLTDRFFIKGMGGSDFDFSASLSLGFKNPGLDASASLGFVTVKLSSVDHNDRFEIGVGFDLNDFDGDGKLTLTELLGEFSKALAESRLPNLLTDVTFNGVDASDILRIKVEVTPSLGDFQLVDPTKHLTFKLVKTASGLLSISMEGLPQLGDINEFIRTFTGPDGGLTSFGFSQVLSALRTLTGFLSTFQSFGFLNEKIPLIGKSIADLVSIANQFNDALSALTRDPASALQSLRPILRDALGAAPWRFTPSASTANTFTIIGDHRDVFPVGYAVEVVKGVTSVFSTVQSISYSEALNNTVVTLTTAVVAGVTGIKVDPVSLTMVSGGTAGAKLLRIDLLLVAAVDKGISLALPNLSIPGLGDAISLTGGAGLNLTAKIVARLALGLDLGDITKTYLFDATSIKASLSASGSSLSFAANLGPISLGVVGGSASLKATAAVTLDPSLFTGGRTALSGSTIGAIIAALGFTASGTIEANLPVTLSGLGLGAITIPLTNLSDFDPSDIQLPDKLTDPSLVADLLQSLNFLDALALLPSGIDAFLDALQGIIGSDVLSIALPFLGDQLSSAARFLDDVRRQFVTPLQEIIDAIKNAAADFANQDKNQVSVAIYGLLGPGGLGLLRDRNGDGQIRVNDILCNTNMPSPPSFGQAYAEWLLEIGGTYRIGTGLDFDIGIPGLGLETTGAIAAVLQWSLMLGFGISGDKGVYFVLAPDDRPELRIDAWVEFTGVSITGKLAFLELKGTVKEGTEFGASFAVNLGLDSGGNEVGITDLGDLTVALEAAAVANARLGLSLGINSDIGAVAAGFPKIVADFVFRYGFGGFAPGAPRTLGSSGTMAERVAALPRIDLLEADLGDALWEDALTYVALEDIGLDLGLFLSEVLYPLVAEIKKAIEPVMPIIEAATTPIPVISELSGEPVTLLTLAGWFGEFDDGMIQSIADILKLIDAIPGPGDVTAGTLVIPLYTFVIYGDDNGTNRSVSIWDEGADLGSVWGGRESPWGTGGFLGELDKLASSGGASMSLAGRASGGIMAANGSTGSGLLATIKEIANGKFYGLTFPFLQDPTQIFQLFMGKDIGLIAYDLKPFSFEFSYEQYFPIMGPLGVSIAGSVGVAIDLGFGYSTRGIRQFVQNDGRNLALLLDGFYFMDVQGNPATDVPELKVWGSITAAAQVNLVVAKAGVKGGIFLEIRFDLNDPDNDGMVHISELAANFMNEWRFGEKALAPLAIFDISGDITARLFAFIYVDLFFFSIDWEQDIVPPITIVEFNFSFGRHPVWANELPNGDVVLNIGPSAGQRVHGPLDGSAAEAVTVTGTRSSLMVNGQEYKLGATGKIIAKGGGGDDVIDLSGVTDAIDCIIDGGAGNDVIKAPAGGGKAIIIGGAGDDEIHGGAGNDEMYGNAGNDKLYGGGGNDIVFGDDGAITYNTTTHRYSVVVNVGSTDGNDTIEGNAGNDVLFGAGGKDEIRGGPDGDLIFGDCATVEFSFGSITLHKVEGTEAGKRGDADALYGDGGDDFIFGGVGNDTIEGGDGNDFLFGESGKDAIKGGAGNDDIFGDGWWKLAAPVDPAHPYRPASGGDDDDLDGGEGNDRLWGGDGNDIMKGGDGDDYLYGGLGNDRMWGDLENESAGAGDDRLYGQGDNDTIFGGNGNDILDGGLGDDALWGSYGPVVYDFGVGEARVSKVLAGPGDRDTLYWTAGVDMLDGQGDSDEYIVDFAGGTAIGRGYAFDSGVETDGIDKLKVNGTIWADVFLLRGVDDGDRGLGFVAMLNADPSRPVGAPQPVERADYDNIERIIVNGSLGNDRFFVDDVHGECTLNGGGGEDVFQIGQMYRSERIYPNVSKGNDIFEIDGVTYKEWVTPDYLAPVVEDPFPRVGKGTYSYPGGDQYMTVETTRGFLSRGVRFPITVNGGPGNDLFTVFHNEAVANLNGEAGDDIFLIKAFALAGSQEPKRGRTDTSGGDGTDLVMYVVNAPVNIDGGEGFDRVIIVGTEFGDDIVITKNGVYGAGLNVNYVNIESLEVDGAEGDDRFYVQSTSEKFITCISGGLGNDTFSMSGDVPPVVSNDLLGHSGIIKHSIEVGGDDGAGYAAGFKIDGVSANVADDDEPAIRITQSGGGTAVIEGSSTCDDYTIVLTRAPVGNVVVRALVPTRSPTDEELNAVAFRLSSPDADSTEVDGSGLTFIFSASDWDQERIVRVWANGVGNDAAYENTRSGFINHMVTQPLGTYRGGVNGVELVTIPDDTVQYDPKVRYETVLTLTHDLTLDGDPIPNPFVAGELTGALFEIVDGTGIGQRMLIKTNGEHTVTVYGKFRRDPDGTSRYLIRRYHELALPSVLVTIYDDDAADVAIFEIEPDDTAGSLDIDGISAVVEGGNATSGSPDRIAVRLTKALTGSETVVIGLSNPDGQLVLGASQLTFTAADWSQPQRVTIAAVDDTVREGTHYGIVLFKVLSGPGDAYASTTDVYEHTMTPEDPVYADALAAGHVFRPDGYVGLSFNPKDGVVTSVTTIENGQTRTLAADEYYVEGNLVIFLNDAGDPRIITGKVTVQYTYVKPGYLRAGADALHIEPVLVEIADNEVPGVIIHETGGSTDVIETTAHIGDSTPWSDSYTVSLAARPSADVWISVTPDFTKTTRGRIRHDRPQVYVHGGANTGDSVYTLVPTQNIRGDWFMIGVLKLKFTPANWDTPQEVLVYAVQDSVVDGGDTKVFAPKRHTVAGIQGPVYVEGAGGSGSLIDMRAQLLPGEMNKKEPSAALVAYNVGALTGVVTATVTLADALELAGIEDGDITKLLYRTLEITSGPAIDKFQLIVDADIDPSNPGRLILTLNAPYLLPKGAVIRTDDPADPTLYTITRESLNFFVDESKCVDFMFVYDEDSVADSSGRIQNLTTVGFEGNGTVAEFVTRLAAKRLTGLQMGGDLVIGRTLQPGGVTYGGLEVVEVNLGSGHNTFVIENTHHRTDFQTWTMVNTGEGDDQVTIAVSSTRYTGAAAAGSAGATFRVAGASYAPNALRGFLFEITSGDLKGTRREVIANTADTLSLSAPWEIGEGGVPLVPAAGDTFVMWLEDGPIAVNGQRGNDVIDGSVSTIPLVVFGSEGDDVISGGSADDILFGDLGRVDYYDEGGRLVTRLGVDRAEITGHTAGAATLVGPPDPMEEWLSTLTSQGTPFASWMLDGVLTGCELQTVNGPGFGQFLFILDYDASTLTLRGAFDPIPYREGTESTWRIPILPENQTDGEVRAPTLVMSRDRSVGGRDTIYGRAGADLIIGGADADVIMGDSFSAAPSDGPDVIFGDNGRMEFQLSGGIYDGDPFTLDRAFTLDPAFGGTDFISGGGADDIIFGGTSGDFILGGAGDDLVLGDFGEARLGTVDVNMLGALTHRTQYPLYVTVTDDALGGADTVFAGSGEDVLIGGAYGDVLDGGENDDLIFGDNVVLDRRTTYSDFTDPRYRTDSGVVYDARGNVVVGAQPRIAPALTGTAVWANWDMTLLHHDTYHATSPSSRFGDDYIAGGPHDDMIFGQLGSDTIQGDGSIAGRVYDGQGVSARRLPDGTLTLVYSADAATDGDDYIEGNGGSDTIFGNLGQDDIIGGSSSLFSLTTPDRRPDGEDMILGGSGTQIARNTYGDPSHARDADSIAGDNADIYRVVVVGASGASSYRTFNYDTYAGGLRIIPRAIRLLDYTPGGPDYRPADAVRDIGAADEIHGESGDDAIYGMVGDDVAFGDAGDDDIVGGWGNDWISGGTGQDGVLGDDGRILTSRNSATYGEPLFGIQPLRASDPDTKYSNGDVLNEFIYTPGKIQTATLNPAGALKKTVNLEPFNLQPTSATNTFQDPLHRPLRADDIIYGGLDSDFLHGGAGDDAMSGAEALPSFFAAPFNPGNVLAYGMHKTGEFANYDEYDPWRKVAGFLLNFAANEGPLVADATYGSKATDGDDAIFGDLGNDWIVGGTGRDTLYGGYGDDLLNADDDHDTLGGTNRGTDTHPSYEDRAYGGAGRDVLIANTGGDRLIDWVGEFNSYIVPFAPYGIATVSRTLQPQLPEFLYALSRSQGIDPTRTGDTGASGARNGEPEGEMGLVLQKDADWHDQTGAPDDPQAGNIPGGPRDVLRSATFNDGTAQGFSPDSGTWSVRSGRLEVAPEVIGADAVSVFYVDSYLPRYYEIQATINAAKPIGGYKANAYLIFDYRSPTDFKFAGINISNDKIELGYRDASGWKVVAQTPTKLRPDTDYRLLVSVNGTYVTVAVDGKQLFAYTFASHVDADGFATLLNRGMVGLGANNARARIDNVGVQILPPAISYTARAEFDSDPSRLVSAPSSGSWTVSGGEAVVANVTGYAVALSRVAIDPAYILRIQSDVRTSGSAGIVFDYYDSDDFKFAMVDAKASRVILGHVRRGQFVIDAAVAYSAPSGTARVLGVTLVGNVVTVVCDGRPVITHVYNALLGDGAFGLIAMAGASFGYIDVRTDDPSVELRADAPDWDPRLLR